MLCLRPLILDTRLQIFNAGPSFSPMYFIIMSELSRSRAFPSISWKETQKSKTSFNNRILIFVWTIKINERDFL